MELEIGQGLATNLFALLWRLGVSMEDPKWFRRKRFEVEYYGEKGEDVVWPKGWALVHEVSDDEALTFAKALDEPCGLPLDRWTALIDSLFDPRRNPGMRLRGPEGMAVACDFLALCRAGGFSVSHGKSDNTSRFLSTAVSPS